MHRPLFPSDIRRLLCLHFVVVCFAIGDVYRFIVDFACDGFRPDGKVPGAGRQMLRDGVPCDAAYKVRMWSVAVTRNVTYPHLNLGIILAQLVFGWSGWIVWVFCIFFYTLKNLIRSIWNLVHSERFSTKNLLCSISTCENSTSQLKTIQNSQIVQPFVDLSK